MKEGLTQQFFSLTDPFKWLSENILSDSKF